MTMHDILAVREVLWTLLVIELQGAKFLLFRAVEYWCVHVCRHRGGHAGRGGLFAGCGEGARDDAGGRQEDLHVAHGQTQPCQAGQLP